MDAKIIDQPVFAPAECMFTKRNGRVIDFLRDFDMSHAGRIYLDVDYAKEIGKLVGMGDVSEVAKERDEALEKVQALEKELAEQREFRSNVEWTFAAMDRRVRKKSGRKPKQPA